ALRASSASSAPSRCSSPRSRWSFCCSRLSSGTGVFAAARTRIGAATIRTTTPKNTTPRTSRPPHGSVFHSLQLSCDERQGRGDDSTEEQHDHDVFMVQFPCVEQVLQGEKIDVVQHHEEGESPEHGEEDDAQPELLRSRRLASAA